MTRDKSLALAVTLQTEMQLHLKAINEGDALHKSIVDFIGKLKKVEQTLKEDGRGGAR